ncbi:MAG: tripartite tricarboxylate transporter substrate binding protein [Betaproteobacteria bacterium]|nr:tripartite tricarboxylate transporter substrate binding protein [Betaproteobacteria bacterium]
MSGAIVHSQPASGAAKYPSKPIRWVVPSSAGGGNDVLARLIGGKMTQHWGQPVVVDNRPGAGGIIGSDIVAKSAADGYTILIVAGGFAINPSLYKKIPYDTVNDFERIVYLANAPLVLVVHSSVPVNSVQELIALAKARPGQLNYATSGVGTTSFLASELFRYMARVQMVHVPYKGAGATAAAVISGQVHLAATIPNATVPHLRTGRVRALGVTSSKRLNIIPEVPTIAEQGLAGYEVVTAFWALVPAKTLKSIINALNAEINRILQMPETRREFETIGFTPVGGTSDELTAVLRSEMARWSKVLKELGVRPE